MRDLSRMAQAPALKGWKKRADSPSKPNGGERSKMATIRASCNECGDVELTTGDVHVRVCVADNKGTYAFRCPVCHMTIVKPAEPRTVDLLVASGVSYSTWSPPLELSEPRDFG